MQKKKDAFITVGYTNWKDAAGDKSGGFPTHERSEVGYKLSHSSVRVAICLIQLTIRTFPCELILP